MKLKDVNMELFGSLPDDIEKNEKAWKEVHVDMKLHTCTHACIIYVHCTCLMKYNMYSTNNNFLMYFYYINVDCFFFLFIVV